MKNLPYLLALHTVFGLGPIRLKRLVEYYVDPLLIWKAETKELISLGIPSSIVEKLEEKRRTLNPEVHAQTIFDKNIKILTVFDENYPQRLKEIPAPPTVLYYKGEMNDTNERALGVVGTRRVTSYGRTVTEKFVQELVNASFTIVSGLATGVDTVAHQATLESGGRTIAVLGGGIDRIFPSQNVDLAKKIIEKGGAVISEFPPDYPHLAGNFPARNRIISGLSLGVLVTEAAENSGSLITAHLSLDQGREVFAVPGPITSALSKGPAALIKLGAKLTFEVTDIFEELGIDAAIPKRTDIDRSQFSVAEKQILEFLQNEPKHVDEICRTLKISVATVSGTLLKMEIKGVVKSLGAGNYQICI